MGRSPTACLLGAKVLLEYIYVLMSPSIPTLDPVLQVDALEEDLVPEYLPDLSDRTSEFIFYLKMGMLFRLEG